MGKDASTRRRILNKLLAIDRIGKKLNLERFGCWPSRRYGEHPILFAHFLTLLKSRLRSPCQHLCKWRNVVTTCEWRRDPVNGKALLSIEIDAPAGRTPEC
jgi:hypothetical protein